MIPLPASTTRPLKFFLNDLTISLTPLYKCFFAGLFDNLVKRHKNKKSTYQSITLYVCMYE